ncbi:DivIVA domain-containing protein, partial [Streptomyces sp. UH6]|nr:DivIVA domain-containing protein [Streptomyces sp. UH6]
MFLFLVVALAVVVSATTLAVVGGGDRPVLPDAPPDRLHDPLPPHRAATVRDVEQLRFPPALRGYRMADVDDALTRLTHELTARDERIAALESALDTARADAARATLLAVRADEQEREAEKDALKKAPAEDRAEAREEDRAAGRAQAPDKETDETVDEKTDETVDGAGASGRPD